MRYQSRQFQYIAWEELAQWPTDVSYLYLMSRLRAPERLAIPCLVRATCNPDGPGSRWIAKRFGILPSGESTSLEVKLDGRTWRRRFIAARLDDNPHLAGTGYREQLLQLPDETQRALLGGRWDEAQIGGAILGKCWPKLVKNTGSLRFHTIRRCGWTRLGTWGLGIALRSGFRRPSVARCG